MANDGASRTYLLERALLSMDRTSARGLLAEAAGEQDPVAAVENLLVPALERIGSAWEAGTIALSQYYMAGRICEDLLRAALPAASIPPPSHPRMAMAVLEDHHVLGKRIVLAALHASGFSVEDFGSAGVEELAERTVSEAVEVLLISTLMLPSALHVPVLRERIEARGSHPVIVVGGAPFRLDPRLWTEVGADAMGSNGADAIAIVRDQCRRLSCESR